MNWYQLYDSNQDNPRKRAEIMSFAWMQVYIYANPYVINNLMANPTTPQKMLGYLHSVEVPLPANWKDLMGPDLS